MRSLDWPYARAASTSTSRRKGKELGGRRTGYQPSEHDGLPTKVNGKLGSDKGVFEESSMKGGCSPQP